jgi:F-type H+-transporting ATPase subunit gamma
MSLLIQLRYRIKAIDTIKKITHAMRLISMSSRSRLKNKEEPLQEYIKASSELLNLLRISAPTWTNAVMHPIINESDNPLVILIGSQRGLCGNFNSTLFHFFEKVYVKSKRHNSIKIIPVGKKAIQYAENNPLYTIIESFPNLHAKTLPLIARDILEFLAKQEPKFTTVIVFSNKLKTFFIQKPYETVLIPLIDQKEYDLNKPELLEEYYWQQSPQELLEMLSYQVLEAHIQYLLFQSLLAEHAARFISMDNATRNAQKLLEETQLQYNKLRQAKITKELTELVSSI